MNPNKRSPLPGALPLLLGLAAVVAAALIGALYWFDGDYLGRERDPNAKAVFGGSEGSSQGASVDAALSPAAADATGGGAEREVAPWAERLVNAASEADRSLVLQQIAAFPASFQWEVLSHASVADSAWAKAARRRMLNACNWQLHASSDLVAEKDVQLQPLVRAWCRDLLDDQGSGQLLSAHQVLLGDHEIDDYLADQSTYVDREGLSDRESALYEQQLRSLLRERGNPDALQSAIRDLFQAPQGGLWEGWERERDRLTGSQRGTLELMVGAVARCELLGGCGPLNPLTVEHCATYAWMSCPEDVGLGEIARLNLSPAQYQLMQQILRRIQCIAASVDPSAC